MWILATIAGTALAAPCATPLTNGDVAALAERADAALDNDDMVAHAQVFSEIRDRAHCLEEALDAASWARLLVSYSLVEYALDRNWRAPLTAALTAYPEVNHDLGPDDIRKYPAAFHDTTHWIPLNEDATFYLDGKQVDKVPPGALEGPHIVQSFAAGEWDTRYLADEPYPDNWLRPSTATSATVKRSPAPLFAGLGLVGAGAATGTATWAMTRDRPVATEGEEASLKAANVVGWAAAGIGSGLVAVHFLGGRRVHVGAGELRLAGRF